MSPRTITCRDLRFYQIHNVIVRAKKAYLSLRGKHILQLLMKFVWHPNYTTHSFLLQENSEKMLRKSLFCRKTHRRYAGPARAHPPRERPPRRANRPDCLAKKAPVGGEGRGRPRSRAGCGAVRAKKTGKAKTPFPSGLPCFVCRLYRPFAAHTGQGRGGAGHSGIRRNLWIIRSGQ